MMRNQWKKDAEAKDLLLAFLRDYCVGKHNAKKSREFQMLMGVKGADIRRMVNELRFAGHPICSGKEGYWYAETEDEVLETLNNLQSRVYGINKAINGLERYLAYRV